MNERETCQTVELDNFEINIEIQLAVLNGRVCHHARGGVLNASSLCAGGIETCILVSCHVNVPYCYWFERTCRYVILMLQRRLHILKSVAARKCLREPIIVGTELLLKTKKVFQEQVQRNFIQQADRGMVNYRYIQAPSRHLCLYRGRTVSAQPWTQSPAYFSGQQSIIVDVCA